MKIAVTSTGKDLDSRVDPRFGRAAYILIVDSSSLEVEVVDNSSNVNAFKGAGIQAAASASDRGANILMTGFCGPNAFKTLQAAGIKVVNNVEGTVRSAIAAFNEEKVTFAEEANADGHW